MPFDCDICMENFNVGNRKPIVGTCGHTYCQNCTSKFEKSTCPECRLKNAFAKSATNSIILKLLSPPPLPEKPGKTKSTRIGLKSNGRPLVPPPLPPTKGALIPLPHKPINENPLKFETNVSLPPNTEIMYNSSDMKKIIQATINGSSQIPQVQFKTSMSTREFQECFNGYNFIFSSYKEPIPSLRPLVFVQYHFSSRNRWITRIVLRRDGSFIQFKIHERTSCLLIEQCLSLEKQSDFDEYADCLYIQLSRF